ncbi:autotransporter beta-domain protein [Orientia chuto str. Dubai]|uniref:Autotransporter beta-domain protein n=1 Tax=Orientia chuto str. Dubai TaxID=1359168 RepID=A0A0F3MKN4_9RICK|nr:autotransporter outer membrane beta-barrel domain-containing protein [Candidatus Orientia mediorientalis]KJV56201.1 autotransporter beta-domain protein [Orientia chuto str. Dubai]
MKNSKNISLIFFTTLFTLGTITNMYAADKEPSAATSNNNTVDTNAGETNENTGSGTAEGEGTQGNSETSEVVNSDSPAAEGTEGGAAGGGTTGDDATGGTTAEGETTEGGTTGDDATGGTTAGGGTTEDGAAGGGAAGGGTTEDGAAGGGAAGGTAAGGTAAGGGADDDRGGRGNRRSILGFLSPQTTPGIARTPIVLRDLHTQSIVVQQNPGNGAQPVRIFDSGNVYIEDLKGDPHVFDIEVCADNMVLYLPAKPFKKIRRLNLGIRRPLVVINNTSQPQSSLVSGIRTSVSAPELSGSESDTERSRRRTSERVRRAVSIFFSPESSPFDLSVLNSVASSDPGIVEGAINATIGGYGPFYTSKPTSLPTDLIITGSLAVKAPLELTVPGTSVLKELRVNSPTSFAVAAPGALNLQSSLAANIAGQDTIINSSGSNSRIACAKIGSPGEPVKINVLNGKLFFNPAGGVDEVNIHAAVASDTSRSAKMIFDNLSTRPIKYNVHGSIATPQKPITKVSLNRSTTLNVLGNIYAHKLKMKVQDNTENPMLLLNGTAYLGSIYPSMPLVGRVIVEGSPSSSGGVYQCELLCNTAGTREKPLHSIVLPQHNITSDGIVPCNKVFITHDKTASSTNIHAGSVIFFNMQDMMVVSGKSANIAANISVPGSSGGSIVVDKGCALTHSGHIGHQAAALGRIQLQDGSSFTSDGNVFGSHTAGFVASVREILLNKNSTVTFNSATTWNTSIQLDGLDGSGTQVIMSKGDISANIGCTLGTVESVTILPKSAEKKPVVSFGGTIYTNNCVINPGKTKGRLIITRDTKITQSDHIPGVIDIGNADISLSKSSLTLEGDKIKMLGYKSQKSHSTNPNKLAKKQVTTFHVGYDVDQNGSIIRNGCVVISSKHLSADNKLVFSVVHSNGSEKDLTRKAVLSPVAFSGNQSQQGDLYDLVYLCDDKCRWKPLNPDIDEGGLVKLRFGFDGFVEQQKGDSTKPTPESEVDVLKLMKLDDEQSQDDEKTGSISTTETEEDDSTASGSGADSDDEAASDDASGDGDDGHYAPPLPPMPTRLQLSVIEQPTSSQSSASPALILPVVTSDAALKIGVKTAVNAVASIVESKVSREHDDGSSVKSAGSDISNQSLNIWSDVFLSNVNQQKHEHMQGYKTDISGITIGADKYLNANTIVGTAVSYSKFNTKYDDSRIEKIDSSVFLLSFYGQYSFKSSTFIRGMINVAKFSDNTNNSELTLWQGNSYHGSFTAGYYFYPLKNTKKLTLVPTLGVKYSQFNTSINKATGSSSSNIGDRSHKTLEGVIGISLEQLFTNNTSNNVLSAIYGYIHHNLYDCQDGAKLPNHQFSFNPNVITVHEKCLHKTFYHVGAKLSIKRNIMEIGIACDIYMAEKYISHTGTIYAKASF